MRFFPPRSRVITTPTPATDLTHLGEVIAYPPHGIQSLPQNDPCDEVMPPSSKKDVNHG